MQIHPQFSRQELKKVVAMYPGKEVKKGLVELYRKVEKHLTEESSLLQVVWRNMQVRLPLASLSSFFRISSSSNSSSTSNLSPNAIRMRKWSWRSPFKMFSSTSQRLLSNTESLPYFPFPLTQRVLYSFTGKQEYLFMLSMCRRMCHRRKKKLVYKRNKFISKTSRKTEEEREEEYDTDTLLVQTEMSKTGESGVAPYNLCGWSGFTRFFKKRGSDVFLQQVVRHFHFLLRGRLDPRLTSLVDMVDRQTPPCPAGMRHHDGVYQNGPLRNDHLSQGSTRDDHRDHHSDDNFKDGVINDDHLHFNHVYNIDYKYHDNNHRLHLSDRLDTPRQ